MTFFKKIMFFRVHGSMTVEASFVCSLIILILVMMSGFTLTLYEKVLLLCKQCIEELGPEERFFVAMRLERIICEKLPE